MTLCVVGLLGSLFVGYCVYFDKKRRSDPDYKKKVVASKLLSFDSLIVFSSVQAHTVQCVSVMYSLGGKDTFFCIHREENEKIGCKEKHHRPSRPQSTGGIPHVGNHEGKPKDGRRYDKIIETILVSHDPPPFAI